MIWSTLPQQPVSERESRDYLGNAINKEARLKHVFFKKMQEIRRTCFQILPYWKAMNANQKKHICVFDGGVRSKLLYGSGDYAEEN